MEKYIIDIMAGIAVLLIGGAVVAIVKATLNSFVLSLQKEFVTKELCGVHLNADAKEREEMRKDIQNHEERLNEVGA